MPAARTNPDRIPSSRARNLWIVQQRAYAVLAGAIAAYGTAAIAAFSYNPNSMDYFSHTFSTAIATPCGVGAVLRGSFGPQHFWLQFLPACWSWRGS